MDSHLDECNAKLRRLREENLELKELLTRTEHDLKSLWSQHTTLQTLSSREIRKRVSDQKMDITQSRNEIIAKVGLPRTEAANARCKNAVNVEALRFQKHKKRNS